MYLQIFNYSVGISCSSETIPDAGEDWSFRFRRSSKAGDGRAYISHVSQTRLSPTKTIIPNDKPAVYAWPSTGTAILTIIYEVGCIRLPLLKWWTADSQDASHPIIYKVQPCKWSFHDIYGPILSVVLQCRRRCPDYLQVALKVVTAWGAIRNQTAIHFLLSTYSRQTQSWEQWNDICAWSPTHLPMQAALIGVIPLSSFRMRVSSSKKSSGHQLDRP